MSPETTTAVATDEVDASVIRGGPFYRAELAIRLISSNQWNHALSWLSFG